MVQKIQNLRERLAARKVDGEQGSLLLDVLIGMAIFALIALIAISAITGYRQRAYETGATSDAQGLALEMEANYTENQAYPNPGGTWSWASDTNSYVYTPNGAAPIDFDQKTTKFDTVASYLVQSATAAQPEGFCLLVTHHNASTWAVDAWANYSSAKGAVTDSGHGSGAPMTCTI